MRLQKRLTEAQFASVRPWLKISERRIQAAYAARVEGKSMSAISRDAGWCRQAVSKTVAHVWKTFQAHQETLRKAAMAERLTVLPPGWQEVTIIAPINLIEKFRLEILEYAGMRENQGMKEG